MNINAKRFPMSKTQRTNSFFQRNSLKETKWL